MSEPNLGGVDFSQYRNWQVITTPTGGTYYAVPGTAFVYDPFTSAAKGRPVLWLNPKPTLEAKRKEEELRESEIRSVQRARSPEGQLIPVVGGVGGTIAGAYAYNQFSKDPTPIVKDPSPAASTVAQQTTAQATQVPGAVGGSIQPTVPMTQGQAVAAGAASDPIAGPGPSGSVLMQDGSITTPDVVAVRGIPEQPEVVAVRPVPGEQGLTFANAAQGAAGALQLYQGYNAAQRGDYLGAGVYGAGGAASLGAAYYGAGSTAAAALPYLGAAAGAYGIYDTNRQLADMPRGGARNQAGAIGGATAGAAIGTAIAPGVGTAIGAAVGLVAGLADSYFGSSKDKYQMMRDKGREALQQFGILDQNYQGTLADGSTYDFGKDGKTAGKLNTSDPNWNKVAALANVIASGEGNSGQGREAMATLYSNAAMSNAGGDLSKSVANLRHFAEQRGLTVEGIQQVLDQLKSEKQISDNEYSVYSADARELLGGAPISAPPKGNPVTNPTAPPQTKGGGVGTMKRDDKTPLVNGAKPPADVQRMPVNQQSGPWWNGNDQYYARLGKEVANRLNQRR